MDYQNKFCPVCKADFTVEDDIVVCPECGTPHHRECWFSTGKCANTALHGLADDVSLTYKREVETTPAEEIKADETPTQHDFASKFLGMPDDEDEDGEGYSTERIKQEIAEHIEDIQSQRDKVLIDGKKAEYYEIAVQKNQRYYIPRFLAITTFTKKVLNYNTMAFITPFSWSIHRKMYKFAALFVALYMAILGFTGIYMYRDGEVLNATQQCIEEDPNFLENIMLYTGGDDVVLTAKQQNLVDALESHTLPSFVSTIISVIFLASRLLYAFSANKLYMKEIGKTIELGEKLGYTDDKLKIFISRKKGVVPFIICAILGYFEIMTFLL